MQHIPLLILLYITFPPWAIKSLAYKPSRGKGLQQHFSQRSMLKCITLHFFFLRNSFFEVCKYIILFVINEMEGKGQHHKQEHISFSPAHDPRIANTSASCFCVLRQEPPQRQTKSAALCRAGSKASTCLQQELDKVPVPSSWLRHSSALPLQAHFFNSQAANCLSIK